MNSCPLLHVSFQPPDSPFPAVLPMIGQMGSFDRPSADLGDVLDLYLHGCVPSYNHNLPPSPTPLTPQPSYVSSRVMNLTRNTNNTDTTSPQPHGLPLTIAASHLDGLVLSLTPNSHSYNYRSAILFGHATLVTDVDEKLYAMELITNSIVPQRWTNTRTPPNAAEMQSTSVLRVRISAGSAKIRTGGPHDERGDLEDRGLVERVWTGVVPVYSVLGEPVAGGYNALGEVPGYIEGWRGEVNKEAEGYAREAVGREVVRKKVDGE